MNHHFTLTGSSLTYDLAGPLTTVGYLEVYNGGPDILYYGCATPKYTQAAPLIITAADVVSTSITTGSPIITLGRNAPSGLKQGMVIDDSAGIGASFPAATTVIAIRGNKITLSANSTSTDTDFTGSFYIPTLDTATNAIPIQSGETVRFTAADGSAIANKPIRFLAASGATCAARFRQVWN